MDSELSKSLHTLLPAWVIVPGVFLLWIVTQWSKIREFWEDWVPTKRAFSEEKRKLELLKLRYEIEALKRAHNLEPLDEPAFRAEVAEQKAPPRPPIEEPSETVPRSGPAEFFRRFIPGTTGAFIFHLGLLIGQGVESPLLRLGDELARLGVGSIPLLLLVILSLVGGGAAYVLTDSRTSRQHCFMIGLATGPILLSVIPTSPSPKQLLPTRPFS